jgi:predicted tellurium resistance membrane protein TerC
MIGINIGLLILFYVAHKLILALMKSYFYIISNKINYFITIFSYYIFIFIKKWDNECNKERERSILISRNLPK